jgi:hypothetical protein
MHSNTAVGLRKVGRPPQNADNPEGQLPMPPEYGTETLERAIQDLMRTKRGAYSDMIEESGLDPATVHRARKGKTTLESAEKIREALSRALKREIPPPVTMITVSDSQQRAWIVVGDALLSEFPAVFSELLSTASTRLELERDRKELAERREQRGMSAIRHPLPRRKP